MQVPPSETCCLPRVRSAVAHLAIDVFAILVSPADYETKNRRLRLRRTQRASLSDVTNGSVDADAKVFLKQQQGTGVVTFRPAIAVKFGSVVRLCVRMCYDSPRNTDIDILYVSSRIHRHH